MATQTAAAPLIGSTVLLSVPRSTNGGQDHVPAIVTRVNKDGTVAVYPQGYPATSVHDRVRWAEDRDEAVKALTATYQDLPGHTTDDDDKVIPGTNSLTGRPWHVSDSAHWQPVAYPVPRPLTADEQAAVDKRKAAKAAAEREKVRARLLAELARLDAPAGPPADNPDDL